MWKFTSHCVNHVKTAIPSILQNTTECFAQQTRNTFVLKRKYKVELSKKHRHCRRLTSRHFIYDFVENRDFIKPTPVDLILVQNVKKFGEVGDKISVNPELAYNMFLLPKRAVYASPENIEKYYVQKQKQAVKYSSKCVKATIQNLSTMHLAVEMSPTEPWTLEKWHIRVSFRKVKYILPETAITLPPQPITGPNEDLEDKQFYVTVTINDTEQVKVRCSIKHWKDVQPQYNAVFYCHKGTAIFPEDQPILDAMPLMEKDNTKEEPI